MKKLVSKGDPLSPEAIKYLVNSLDFFPNLKINFQVKLGTYITKYVVDLIKK